MGSRISGSLIVSATPTATADRWPTGGHSRQRRMTRKLVAFVRLGHGRPCRRGPLPLPVAATSERPALPQGRGASYCESPPRRPEHHPHLVVITHVRPGSWPDLCKLRSAFRATADDVQGAPRASARALLSRLLALSGTSVPPGLFRRRTRWLSQFLPRAEVPNGISKFRLDGG